MDWDRFAKDRIDVGVATDDPEVLVFVERTVGVAPETLRVSRSTTQFRFDVRSSILKVNLVEGTTPAAKPLGDVLLVHDVTEPETRLGPAGLRVTLVPPGHDGVEHLDLELGVCDVAAARDFYGVGMGWDIDGDDVVIGKSRLRLRPDDSISSIGLSWAYFTVQIRDCDAETERAVAHGARVERPPRTYGETARFSMVTDPDGNLFELSQRASLTGPLPTNE